MKSGEGGIEVTTLKNVLTFRAGIVSHIKKVLGFKHCYKRLQKPKRDRNHC